MLSTARPILRHHSRAFCTYQCRARRAWRHESGPGTPRATTNASSGALSGPELSAPESAGITDTATSPLVLDPMENGSPLSGKLVTPGAEYVKPAMQRAMTVMATTTLSSPSLSSLARPRRWRLAQAAHLERCAERTNRARISRDEVAAEGRYGATPLVRGEVAGESWRTRERRSRPLLRVLGVGGGLQACVNEAMKRIARTRERGVNAA